MSHLNAVNFFRSCYIFSSTNCCNACVKSSLLTSATNLINVFSCNTKFKFFHTSVPLFASHFKHRDRKELLKTVPKMDEGTVGEEIVSLDAIIKSREDMFIDEKTPNLLFNGVPFREVPIVNIKVTKNNTHVSLSDHKGKVICFRTCGMEGFKNCRKGTNVAGQTTALFISSKAMRLGVRDVRLKIQGLGPGRMASVKGIQMGGLNIISVTDDTRITFKPTLRPRKPKRL